MILVSIGRTDTNKCRFDIRYKQSKILLEFCFVCTLYKTGIINFQEEKKNYSDKVNEQMFFHHWSLEQLIFLVRREQKLPMSSKSLKNWRLIMIF
jgi:hypothetical protein